MDKITLPIACASPFLDDRWTLAYMPFVRVPKVLSSSVRNSWTSFEAVFFSTLPMSVDPIVDRLVTKPAHMPGTFHVSDNLFWREGILQEPFDIHFELGIVVDHAELHLGSSSAAQHSSVGMLFEIHATGIRISLQFATDRRSVLTKNARNFSARLMAKMQPTSDFALCKRQVRICPFQTS